MNVSASILNKDFIFNDCQLLTQLSNKPWIQKRNKLMENLNAWPSQWGDPVILVDSWGYFTGPFTGSQKITDRSEQSLCSERSRSSSDKTFLWWEYFLPGWECSHPRGYKAHKMVWWKWCQSHSRAFAVGAVIGWSVTFLHHLQNTKSGNIFLKGDVPSFQ